MNERQVSFSGFYTELLLLILGILIATALYFILRLPFKKKLNSKQGDLGSLLARLISPTVFLLVAYVLKFIAAKGLLPVSEKFQKYLNAAVIFLIIVLILRIFDSLVRLWYAKRKIPFPLPKVLHSFILLVLYLILLFGILKGVLGINITPFLATSAVLTMILGLALQGVLGNIFSGLSLHMIDTLKSGDWIKVGTANEGHVIETNWRETKILDRYTNVVIIPNNVVASEILINYSRPDLETALTFPVKVSYDSPPSAVKQALQEAASNVPEILTSPAPEVYSTGYDDFGVSYILKFWIDDYSQKYQIIGKIGNLIWYKLKRRNIEIPVPFSERVSDVLKSFQEYKGISVEKEKTENNYRDLKNSEFLSYLKAEDEKEPAVSEVEIREMAASVQRQKYSTGEILFSQGERGENCFVVASGRLKGIITYEEKGKKHTTEFFLEQGNLFGEMSLFTGMPRTATSIVEEESELLEITASDFARFLSKNPKLTERVAEIVSARNKKNQDFLKRIKELSAKDIQEGCNKHSILERMKYLIRKWTS